MGAGVLACEDPRVMKRGKPADAGSLFVIELSYKVPLEEIDAHMTAHVRFLEKHYASGNFLMSGRKIPRTGGVILAVGENRAQIEALVKEDPFHRHGLADIRVVEFRASQKSDDLQRALESL